MLLEAFLEASNFFWSNKIEILFSNYIFGFTFQSPSSK